MKEFDLDSEIKSLRVPERGRDFWDNFPGRVMAELRAAPEVRHVPTASMPRLAWGLGLALGCLAASLCLGPGPMPKTISHAWLKDRMAFSQSAARIQNKLCTLIRDEHGLHRLIEDQQ
jgi:hypothetical protein